MKWTGVGYFCSASSFQDLETRSQQAREGRGAEAAKDAVPAEREGRGDNSGSVLIFCTAGAYSMNVARSRRVKKKRKGGWGGVGGGCDVIMGAALCAT